MERMIRSVVAATGLLLAASAPAQASWFRNIVDAELMAQPGWQVAAPFGPQTMVDAGREFVGRIVHPTSNLAFDVAVDVNPYEIVIGFSGSQPGTNAVGAPGLLSITLSGLAPQPFIVLTAYSCTEPGGVCYGPAERPEVSLVDNLPSALRFDFTALQDGASYVFAIPVPETVPAPPALLAMGVGLAGLCAAARIGRPAGRKAAAA
jgi:hypothetical protein